MQGRSGAAARWSERRSYPNGAERSGGAVERWSCGDESGGAVSNKAHAQTHTARRDAASTVRRKRAVYRHSSNARFNSRKGSFPSPAFRASCSTFFFFFLPNLGVLLANRRATIATRVGAATVLSAYLVRAPPPALSPSAASPSPLDKRDR